MIDKRKERKEMKMKKENYQVTMIACFIGYIVQAIVNNFAPLLFVTFSGTYEIPLSQITLLVTINFGIQLAVDLLSAIFVDKIGYRISVLLAHAFAAIGLVLLTILPEVMASPFIGILIAVAFYAIGGGLIEVLISPIVEACPTDNKESAMSLLHSFYCWGHVGVVALSTVFFAVAGISHWRVLALLWVIVPVLNFFLFLKAPIAPLLTEEEQGMSMFELLRDKIFWILLIMMTCSGACEQAVSQWASTFAEKGIGMSKTVGDLAGPMMFALLMGTSRAIYGKFGEKWNLDRFMIGSALLCALSYLMISLVPSPVINLIGCGICGLSVGIMWPGSFSKASAVRKRGGTTMFALLALGGDLGCSGGPTYVGMIASAFGDNLKMGVLCALVFPVLLIASIVLCKQLIKKETVHSA